MNKLQSDVVIIGAGISGIVTAIELLDANKKVLIVDRDLEENFGGLAKESFGGIFFVGSNQQRKSGIKDSPELAYRDWCSFAEFNDTDLWPKKWAAYYTEYCTSKVQEWLCAKGIKFFPVVHWVERGLHIPGNSVPRFHMVWGTGYELIMVLVNHLKKHKNAQNCQILFQHHVKGLLSQGGKVSGIHGLDESTGKVFENNAEQVVIASGGVAGNLEKVRKEWDADMGNAPKKLLNGSHKYAIGELHDIAEGVNANVTHINNLWNYAAGVHHPEPNKENHGLSVVPPKSALWVNYEGERIGPQPLVSAYDTRFLVKRVCEQEHAWSWQIMNMKIAAKELAFSGSKYNDAIRNKQFFKFVLSVFTGNKKLVKYMIENCVDFVVAENLEELAERMNELNGDSMVNKVKLKQSIHSYDEMIDRGPKFHNDEQLRKIAQLRNYRGDRARVCNFQKIVDSKAMPLIAVREFILTRKSLGGIQTNLDSQVLSKEGNPIDGLYAVGEAAGFGGGGMHGKRSLEGTFLGGCVLTARAAAKSMS